MEIHNCEICGCLLSVEEQEQCCVGQFRLCKRHYEFVRVLAFLIREGKI